MLREVRAGAIIAAMDGVDAIALSGGIGENDPVVRHGLAFMGVTCDVSANRRDAGALHDASSRVAIWTVVAMEERHIAGEALQVMAGEGTS